MRSITHIVAWPRWHKPLSLRDGDLADNRGFPELLGFEPRSRQARYSWLSAASAAHPEKLPRPQRLRSREPDARCRSGEALCASFGRVGLYRAAAEPGSPRRALGRRRDERRSGQSSLDRAVGERERQSATRAKQSCAQGQPQVHQRRHCPNAADAGRWAFVASDRPRIPSAAHDHQTSTGKRSASASLLSGRLS